MILGLSDNSEQKPGFVLEEENREGLIAVSRLMLLSPFGKAEMTRGTGPNSRKISRVGHFVLGPCL